MADENKGFNLASILGDVSDLDTIWTPDDREQIEYIDVDLIDSDPANFYELSGIDELAANIELIGLQQPLRVRAHPENPDRVIIVSGHRRCEAIRRLVADGRDDFREVACIREKAASSSALQELRLIYANSDTRRMTSADMNKQAQRVEALLYQLKEEGYEFPGRMRDHVAAACKVSKSKLARLKMIRDNLASVWTAVYESDKISESTAYALSQIPEDYQLSIYSSLVQSGKDFRYVYEYLVTKASERFKAIDGLVCKRQALPKCKNIGQKRMKAVRVESWQTFHCDKCCAKCPELATCRFACPSLAEKVKKLKADAREQRRQEQLAKEARDRPIIEQLQTFWTRFGHARKKSGRSVKEVYKVAERFYVSSDKERIESMERGTAKLDPNSTLPFGFNFRMEDARRLVAIADLLGCSLDYLFCRTDDPGGTALLAAPAPQWISGTGRQGEPVDAVAVFLIGECQVKRLAHWDGSVWKFCNGSIIEAECIRWAALPKEEE